MPYDHFKQQIVAILLGMIFSSSQITLVLAFNYISMKTIANIFPHIIYVSSQMYGIVLALLPNNLASNSSSLPVLKNLILEL